MISPHLLRPGIHASKSANRFEALEPVRQGVAERFGEFGPGVGEGLAIRHDHGTAYLSDTFQNELTFLGIASSPAFIREPEGNGCAERFIRILKENLLWVQTFSNVEQLRRRSTSSRIDSIKSGSSSVMPT
mgnify:CR=1 FL=1